MTTQTLLLEWLEKFQKEHIKARTYNRYQGLIEMHIVPALGDRDISSLSRKEIQNFLINQKKDGNMRNKETLSATSTNMMLSLLNLAFEYACDMEYIKENPCIRIRRARADTKKVEAFSTDEQRAVEGIVKYLHKKFSNDIRVIVPQMAMSAGTMLACSASMVLMGAHSCLGPIDPQFGGIPAYNIVAEFREAKEDIENHPQSKDFWETQLKKYPPAFFYSVIDAINLSSTLAGEWLSKYMFSSLDKADVKKRTNAILKKLNNNNQSHSRHFSYDDCEKMGLLVEKLETDQDLQECVLSVHHAFIITIDNSPVTKIIENQLGSRYLTTQK